MNSTVAARSVLQSEFSCDNHEELNEAVKVKNNVSKVKTVRGADKSLRIAIDPMNELGAEVHMVVDAKKDIEGSYVSYMIDLVQPHGAKENVILTAYIVADLDNKTYTVNAQKSKVKFPRNATLDSMVRLDTAGDETWQLYELVKHEMKVQPRFKGQIQRKIDALKDFIK